MKISGDPKERIIKAATTLINESAGDVNYITTRRIAEKAQVGIGLINYHFQTKENLIKICVQNMIREMVCSTASSDNEVTEALTVKERLAQAGKRICDFFMLNPTASRISILADLQASTYDDKNHAINSILADSSLCEKDRAMASFIFTSTIQWALMRKDAMKLIMDNDFDLKKDRDTFIEQLVDVIYQEID